MSKFDKLTEAYMNIVKEKPFDLTDILGDIHSILSDSDYLENVDDILKFLIKKNPSVQNDLIEYIEYWCRIDATV